MWSDNETMYLLNNGNENWEHNSHKSMTNRNTYIYICVREIDLTEKQKEWIFYRNKRNVTTLKTKWL